VIFKDSGRGFTGMGNKWLENLKGLFFVVTSGG